MPSSMSACMFHKLSEEVSKISEAEYKFFKKRKCLRAVHSGKLLAGGLF